MIEFPYQVVAFLDDTPDIGESAYNSPRGWFAQIALKRRFTLDNTSQQQIVETIQQFCDTQNPLTISVGDVVRPERMPVHVLEVEMSDDLINFHNNLIKALGNNLVSRYPERDGDNYLPHITVEYGGGFVVDTDKYRNKKYSISRVCLLKDGKGDDSLAYRYFDLGNMNK